VEVCELEKCCGNTGAGECFHSVSDFFQTLTSVSKGHETQRNFFYYFQKTLIGTDERGENFSRAVLNVSDTKLVYLQHVFESIELKSLTFDLLH